MSVIIWLLIGILGAFVSRFVVPGAVPVGFWDGMVLGVVGSLTGGFLGSLGVGGDVELTVASVICSALGAGVLLLHARPSADRIAGL